MRSGLRTLAGAGAGCILAAQTAIAALPTSYNLSLIRNYAGSTFFDGFTFNASVIDNTTQGNIHYLSRDASTAAGLTYINAAGNAIIKVDNTTSGVGDSTFGRNSIKLVSNASYALGTLFVIDAVHLPYGCSVWPAIWTLSSQYKTDDGGEIDIFEGINNVQNSQYTLHTKAGCTQSNNTAMPYTGNIVSTNCDYHVNGNQGCATRDNRTASYGANFANNGGGVFAMLWDGDGVQTWFFPRSQVPADLNSTATTPYPAAWGPPVASWPSTTCNMNDYFTEQNIVINLTLCGLWAGAQDVFAQTCSGLCTDYIADPRNYDNAYFELKSVRTYTGAPQTASINNSTQIAPTSTSSNAASKTSSSPSSSPSSAAGRLSPGAAAPVVLGALALAAMA